MAKSFLNVSEDHNIAWLIDLIATHFDKNTLVSSYRSFGNVIMNIFNDDFQHIFPVYSGVELPEIASSLRCSSLYLDLADGDERTNQQIETEKDD